VLIGVIAIESILGRNKMGHNYSKAEIIEKLKWFHGEEFEKYPLNDWLFEENNESSGSMRMSA
jgi:hypothetical protein